MVGTLTIINESFRRRGRIPGAKKQTVVWMMLLIGTTLTAIPASSALSHLFFDSPESVSADRRQAIIEYATSIQFALIEIYDSPLDPDRLRQAQYLLNKQLVLFEDAYSDSRPIDAVEADARMLHAELLELADGLNLSLPAFPKHTASQ